MVLCIDIGNTSTTVGLFEEFTKPAFIAYLQTNIGKTSDECAFDLINLFRLNGRELSQVSGGIISSVVPPVTKVVSDAVKKCFGITPLVVGPGVKTGLNIKTEIHNQLGSDIVCCAVAAIYKYPAPIIMIDLGTAITFSSIGRGNAFEGCAICPGMRISLQALSEHAAQLPEISIEETESVIGKNTIDSMRAGIVFGTAGMIDSMIDRIQAEREPAATVVATGGQAPLILKYCTHHILYDRNLLLNGLYLIHQKNLAKIIKSS